MKRASFTDMSQRWQPIGILVIVVLALYIRLGLWGFQSEDYLNEISRWYDFIQQHGFIAFRYDFYPPYTPLYLYLFYIGNTLLPSVPDLFVIKMISIVFDFVCAIFIYRLVRQKYPTGPLPVAAFAFVLFSPSVVWNGALWAQCDAIYTAGLIACIYYLVVDRRTLAFLAYGIALALKLQAIFLAPLLLVLLLKKILPLTYILYVPLVYVLTTVPAWLAGRPFVELLTTHLRQTGFYQSLSMSAPNVYQWVPHGLDGVVYPLGLVAAGAIVLAYCLLAYVSRTRVTTEVIMKLAMVSLLIVPFFLPRMHERYFFPADILSIAFAFYFPRYFIVPLLVQTASFGSYFPFLFSHQVMPLSLLAVLLCTTIVVLSVDLAWTLTQRRLPLSSP